MEDNNLLNNQKQVEIAMSEKSKYFVDSAKVVALSKIFQHGKTQVPLDIRHFLDVKDGDKMLWFSDEKKIYVKKVE